MTSQVPYERAACRVSLHREVSLQPIHNHSLDHVVRVMEFTSSTLNGLRPTATCAPSTCFLRARCWFFYACSSASRGCSVPAPFYPLGTLAAASRGIYLAPSFQQSSCLRRGCCAFLTTLLDSLGRPLWGWSDGSRQDDLNLITAACLRAFTAPQRCSVGGSRSSRSASK